MDHMNDANPHAHALDQDHISNPLIIIHVSCMITAYGILMPLGIMVTKKKYSHPVFINITTASSFPLLNFFFFFCVKMSNTTEP